MTDWTVERLDALPGGTVIEVWHEGWRCWTRFVWDGEVWQEPGEHDSYQSVRFAGLRIRVVSVPVEALMSEDVLDALWIAFDDTGWSHAPGPAIAGMKAAIARITGETS